MLQLDNNLQASPQNFISLTLAKHLIFVVDTYFNKVTKLSNEDSNNSLICYTLIVLNTSIPEWDVLIIKPGICLCQCNSLISCKPW